ncbi:uncharacterized protein NPIL_336961 [Nephila pilipes]|uniref:Tetraspanin n=1 Tax=Nephila pilipes TaxID=299642 RepID=A0A8X6NUU6_NEPPI|nr:uncharacterized protein NPIL_336961 [Nephila pilipes]
MGSDGDVDLYWSKSITSIQSDTGEENSIQYVLSFPISDNLQRIFVLMLIIGNFLSVNNGVVFIILGVYVKNTLESQMNFLQNYYHPRAIPTILIVTGLIMIATSFLGVKAAIGGHNIEESSEAKSAAFYFFMYWATACIAAYFILTAAFICFVEIYLLWNALGHGLLAGMGKYKRDEGIKNAIDQMQINYKCCGADNFTDWYNISWIDIEYIDLNDPNMNNNAKEDEYCGKDVPFSCCRMGELRPCVDKRIEDSSFHSKYTYPTDMTLNRIGCQEAVTNFLGHYVFSGIGGFVCVCLLIWIALVVISRYLQTALTQVSIGKLPVGWLIPYAKTYNAVQN